jgi:hypothetical protein
VLRDQRLELPNRRTDGVPEPLGHPSSIRPASRNRGPDLMR